MPYLHWETSGDAFDHKNALIKELSTVEFHRRDYERPTPEEIEACGDVFTDMKLMRAFLHPSGDRCLHVPKTLNQYYYSTLLDADESFEDQVAYKYAMKQHKIYSEAEVQQKEQQMRRMREMRESIMLDPSSNNSYAALPVPSWAPPKVIMVCFSPSHQTSP
jgi:hypothetical protein